MRLDVFARSADAELRHYTYLPATATSDDDDGGSGNRDFVAGLARLSRYNRRRADGAGPALGELAWEAAAVKPYANLCGLFAVGPNGRTEAALNKYHGAIRRASVRHAPQYD